ncbi:MAG: hypothetical protein ACI8YQ_003872 [Polaribacter sp.]|jgi:hypothetical protein
MSNQTNMSLKLELISWVFTLVLAVAVLFPIYTGITNYPFWWTNILFIVTFITLTRYVFLLQHTFLANRQKLKVVLFFLSIPIVFFLISQVHYFQSFLDEQGVGSFLGNMTLDNRNSMADFVKKEMMLFGIGSVVIAIIFPFRLLLSVWRFRNRGKA